jgi:hypothetical protein
MQNQSEATPNRYDPAPFRTTARIVGVLYLAGMVVGIGGNQLIQSILGGPDHLSTIAANSMLLTLGVVLWLSTVATPVRADQLINDTRRDATPGGQRCAVINNASNTTTPPN